MVIRDIHDICREERKESGGGGGKKTVRLAPESRRFY
jgi:hypothetical protein